MIRDIFFNKWIIAIIGLLVIVAAACVCYYYYATLPLSIEATKASEKLNQRETTQKAETDNEAEVVDYPQDKSLGEKRKTLSDTSDIKNPSAERQKAATISEELHISGSTSSNPLFADGVPEHLQCPEELVGFYTTEVSVENLRKIGEIANEVVERYNPNRPLPDVWPQFIEAEIYYHANADPAKKGLGVAANRFDWGIQSILDYPEIVVLLREDPIRASDMMMVEQGGWEPDWNLHELPDGRKFRTDNGFYYEFIYSSGNDDKFTGTIYSLGHSGSDAERITIDLNETTDEELENLGGWNYNINPYTTGLYKLGDNN
ncbi:hypothetical protein F4083_10945 [Candidatus Poribacteria bacterium]|nr:hypothetical protein [Candidatus Poribacteria bacterium]MYI94817.1 hypothetical protein [Candidatus Poribacteria bacterium]